MSRQILTYIYLITNFQKLQTRLLKFQKEYKERSFLSTKSKGFSVTQKYYFSPFKPCKTLAAFIECTVNNTVLKETELAFKQSEF